MKNKKNQFFNDIFFSRFFTKSAKSFLFKPTVIMLFFLFALQPLAPVFAQEINVITPIISPEISSPINMPVLSPTDTLTPIVSQSPLAMPENPIVSSPDTILPAATEPANTSDNSQPGSLPALEDISVAGSSLANSSAPSQSSEQGSPAAQPAPLTQKLPEIDKNTGALNYSYPIAVPPGRNNFQPDIALSYNSNLNGQNGIFGSGWTVNIPYIQRLNKAGTDSLYSSNYFYSSLDGELTAAGGGFYISKTENGSFNKYNFSNNQWMVVAKNGTQYKFGYELAARQDDSANPGNVYKWMLQEVRDANDNFIYYTYFKDAGQIYPLVIKYTGSGNVDGIFEIEFQRVQRTDDAVSYATGFAVNSNYLIGEINSKINNEWVKKYALSYAKSQSRDASLLKSITASGKNNSGEVISLSPIDFNYQTPTAGFTPANVLWNIPPAPPGFEWNLHSRPPQFPDLNGDGLPDLVIVGQETNNPLGNRAKDFQYLNTGNGWVTAGDSFNYPSPPEGYNWNLASRAHQFADLNGDGLQDLIMIAYGCFQKDSSYFCLVKDQQYLNTGSGWAQTSLWEFPVLPEGESAWQWHNISPQFPDLNGDGLTDIVLVSSRFISNAVGGVLRGNIYFTDEKKQNLLSQINYPQGGNTEIVYKASTQYIDESVNLETKSPYPMFTVSQITNNDGLGNNISSSYKYQGGHYYYNNPFDKQFAGYNLIAQTDSAGNVAKIYYHTANESDSVRGEFEDNYFKIGKPYRIEQYDNTGKIYQATINKWDSYNLGNGPNFLKLFKTQSNLLMQIQPTKTKQKVMSMTIAMETKFKK